MHTFTDVINRWNSVASLAEDIGEEVGTVRQWRNRNVLPDRKWRATVEAAQKRGFEGVTLEVLAEIAERRALRGAATTIAAE